jgi:hypothetical protein
MTWHKAGTTELVFFSAVLRGAQYEDADEVPEEDCDDDVEQDGRDLLLIYGDEIFPVLNDALVGLVATPIGDRKESQQGGEEQSARKEAFEDCRKMLARGRGGDGSEGPPKIEIDQDPRR